MARPTALELLCLASILLLVTTGATDEQVGRIGCRPAAPWKRADPVTALLCAPGHALHTSWPAAAPPHPQPPATAPSPPAGGVCARPGAICAAARCDAQGGRAGAGCRAAGGRPRRAARPHHRRKVGAGQSGAAQVVARCVPACRNTSKFAVAEGGPKWHSSSRCPERAVFSRNISLVLQQQVGRPIGGQHPHNRHVFTLPLRLRTQPATWVHPCTAGRAAAAFLGPSSPINAMQRNACPSGLPASTYRGAPHKA